MKSIFTTIVASLSFLCAFAQQNTNPAFEQLLTNTNAGIQTVINTKNYKEAIRLMELVTTSFYQLPVQQQKEYTGILPSYYYNLACLNALSQRNEVAIAYLDSAFSKGYNNYAHLLKDTDLDGLKTDRQFIKLLDQMKQKIDFGYLLTTAGNYQSKDKRVRIPFTYQDEQTPVLVTFRKKYKLDSVVGRGDEISKIKKLLLWVHESIKHDGGISNPAQQNAEDLIQICKKENRGLNCRMLATVLRDCYQAMGFKSRVVTCMPKDVTDTDCHVINIVWSETLKKWIWMDPTFNAYVSDEKGSLLSIAEVRARLVNNQTLVLNEEANWNNQQQQTKAQYLDHYMSKNLYWITCTTKSEWDLETIYPGKEPLVYINLYPGNFNTLKGNQENGKYHISHATSNDQYFWAPPVQK